MFGVHARGQKTERVVSIERFAEPFLMLSQKVVTPVKTGVQPFHNFLKTLDSGFRRNGEMPLFFLFCECIIPESFCKTICYGLLCALFSNRYAMRRVNILLFESVSFSLVRRWCLSSSWAMMATKLHA